MPKTKIFAAFLILLVLSLQLATCDTGSGKYFTVSFEAGGGEPAPANQKVLKGGLIVEPEEMAREGHDFGSWFADADCTRLWDFARDVVTEDITLHAKWEPSESKSLGGGGGGGGGGGSGGTATFTVTFNSNGGSAVAPRNVTSGALVPQPANPTKGGFVFAGWFTDDGTFIMPWDFTFDTVSANITLYAKWNPIPVGSFVVHFVSNGGTPVPSDQIILSGNLASPPPAMTYPGRTLAGWYRDDGTFVLLWNFAANTVTSDVTLYAKWDSKVVAVAAGYHTVAIKSDSTLWAWGNNQYGQLSDGTTTNKSTPVQIGSDNDWVKVAATAQSTIAIKTDGSLWAWGDNTYGQLGDGTTTNKNIPIRIGTDIDWDLVSVSDHTIAIKNSGYLWAWGVNSSGQLGDGTNTNRYSPVSIGGNNDWKKVVAGSHTIALKSDGSLWAWGANGSGQLGDGTTISKSTPIQIGSDNDWKEVAAWAHTIAIKTTGSLWAWGRNFWGQLGDGKNTDRSSPVRIGSDTDWEKVVAGDSCTVAIKADGSLWAWGYNASGQLGDGTTVNRLSPVQVVFP